MTRENTLEYVRQGGGICGTCCQPANATSENEGYSDCCNDRIEYGQEAMESAVRLGCEHTLTVVERGVAFGLNGARSRYEDHVCAYCGEYVGEARGEQVELLGSWGQVEHAGAVVRETSYLGKPAVVVVREGGYEGLFPLEREGKPFGFRRIG